MGRNWQWSFDHGREQRLKLEREAAEQGIAEVYESRNKHRFKILTTGNSKVAEHCARLRALFADPANKESPCSR